MSDFAQTWQEMFTLRHRSGLESHSKDASLKSGDHVGIGNVMIKLNLAAMEAVATASRVGAECGVAVASRSADLKRQCERASQPQSGPSEMDRRDFFCAIFGFIVASAKLKGSGAFRPKTSFSFTPSDGDGDYVIVGGWVLTTRDLTSDRSA